MELIKPIVSPVDGGDLDRVSQRLEVLHMTRYGAEMGGADANALVAAAVGKVTANPLSQALALVADGCRQDHPSGAGAAAMVEGLGTPAMASIEPGRMLGPTHLVSRDLLVSPSGTSPAALRAVPLALSAAPETCSLSTIPRS